MSQSHFRVKHDDWPLVSSTDELVIVHRNQLSVGAVLFLGAHRDSIVEVRTGSNRETVEIATGPAIGDPDVGGTGLFIPAGGLARFDLPGAGFSALDLVSKVSLLKGQIAVFITSAGEFDAYFKQVDIIGT